MDEPEGSYAPQSPDLSAYHAPLDPSPFPYRPAGSAYHTGLDHTEIMLPQQQQQQQTFFQGGMDAYQQRSSRGEGGRGGAEADDEHNYNGHADQASVAAGTRASRRLRKNARGAPSSVPPPHHSSPQSHSPSSSAAPTTAATATAHANARARAHAHAEEEVDIKTKFPVARIKRIMQADEDVGKVSQVTPVAVSKCLELFMVALVSKSSHEAKSTSSKRITAKHLKQAIAKEEEYDFLQEIINRVPDAPHASSDKAEDATTEGDGNSSGRRGRGRARKETSDDF